MKKLLLVTFFAFLSYISYAPAINSEIQDRKQILIEHRLLIEEFPALAKIEMTGVLSLKTIPLISPVDTATLKQVNSDFGYRKHPVLGVVKHHNGVDLNCPIGTNISSTADGCVEEVKISKFGYGNYIIINHGNGYKTRYAHLQSINVVVGQLVSAGESIGISGRSGLTTGPHLHYEIIKDNEPINPVTFVTSNDKEYIDVLKRIQQYESVVV